MKENPAAETLLLRVDRHLDDERKRALFADKIDDYRTFVAAQQTIGTCIRLVKDDARAHYAQTIGEVAA